jgi:hypothetical protein
MAETSLHSASAWRLAPGHHGVMVDEDLVVLDVPADSYNCLPGAAAQLAFDAGTGALTIEDPDLRELLLGAGWIARPSEVEPPTRQELPSLPTASALEIPSINPHWRDLSDAAAGLSHVWRRYRGQTFKAILAEAGPSNAACRTAPPSPEVLHLARRFHAWAPYAPVSGKCLLRSFMLLRLLRRRGHDALWVFGVRTRPFGAHCWLQIGDVVLDDAHERLAPFHPILCT